MTDTQDKVVNFMGLRKIAAVLSAILLLTAIGSLFANGLQLGLDFTGGTSIEVKYANEPNLDEIRETLESAGYKDVVVQNYGALEDIKIRLGEAFKPDLGKEVLASLQAASAEEVKLRQSSFVGGQVGEELRDQGGIAMLLALALVMIYVAVQFQYKFSVGAVAALMHDVLIVVGIFSLFKIDFDLTVLAAVLAVIGYSLNDTIVVSDRIRENFRKVRRGTSEEIVNISLTQTLGRTLVTSATTLLVLLALLFFGGEAIHNFALALTMGVVVGTYSSIYVASNILLAMDIDKVDLMPPEDKDEELDEIP